MDAAELDIQLEELETRVERLRSLYEQYFLGIEKIPPAVPQKDVDRRLYALRREQIRNTARRFKLQTIIQRYNTYQQYWMRIMREIEHGTYRRHVLRAERTVGITDVLTAGERKRLGLPERPTQATQAPEGESPSPTVDGSDAARPTSERPPAAQVDPAPPTTSSRDTRAQLERELGRMLDGHLDDDLDDLDTKGFSGLGKELDDPLFSSLPPPPNARRPSAKPVPRRSARPIAAPRGQQPPPSPQTQGSSPTSPTHASQGVRQPTEPNPEPNPAATLAPKSSQPARRSLRPSRFSTGSGSPSSPGGLRLPASSAVAGRGLPPLPNKPGVPRGAPPRIPSSPIIPLESKQKPLNAPSPLAAPRPPPTAKPQDPQPSNTAPSPIATAQAVTDAGRGSVPRGLPNPKDSVAPRASNAPARPGATSKSVRPEVAKKPVTATSRTKPPPTPRHEQNRPDPSGSDGPGRKSPDTLDRARIEQLAEKLRDARKQTHESATVSVDALAKKLQGTAEELRKKHAGKQVDFDVIIKDGKAILKPIVR